MPKSSNQWPADNIIRRKVSELWKPTTITGYEVSNFGRVRSLIGSRRRGRVLKQYKMPSGYMQVSLGAGNKFYVHRLVCAAWHGEPESGLEVSHIDGTRDGNKPENLAWVTHSQNEQQKKVHGTYARTVNYWKAGQKKRGPSPTKHNCAETIKRLNSSGVSVAILASLFGMSKSGMYGVIKCRI